MAMTDAQIQADMASLKTQEDLNKYFATSGYSPEQLASAMPQYGSAADYANAVNLGSQAYFAANQPTADTDMGLSNQRPTPTAPVAPVSKWTPEQLAGIKSMYEQYAQSNPAEVVRQMAQYGVDAAAIDAATGGKWGMQAITDTIQRSGTAQDGFGGVTFWKPPADTPTPTSYAEYLKQATAPATDPTQNWLKGTSTPYTQPEWNTLQARIADEKKRGITFGGGSSPSQGGVVNSAAGSIGVTTAASPDITARIKADMAGLKTQADLNRYFATSGYTAEQLAAAMPQYGSAADYKNAMALGVAEYGKTQSNGILGSNTTSESSANGVTPWNVTGEQTVEQRVAGILASGSPLIEQQRAQSDQAMNGRGLLNSSIARTASDAAAYQAALPIAQADAATFAKASGYNADQQNQFATNDLNRAAQLEIARLNADTSKIIASWNNDQSKDALQIQLDNKTLLDTNAQAAQAFNTGMSAVNNIQNNSSMDGPAKTVAIGTVWKNVQTQLKMLSAVSGINISTDLQFAGFPGFDDQGRWVGFGDTSDATVTSKDTAPATSNITQLRNNIA